MPKILVRVNNNTPQEVNCRLVKQDILKQIQFVSHRSIDIDKCYVVTEVSTGLCVYTHVGKLKDCVNDFLLLLGVHKNKFYLAVYRAQQKEGLIN